MATGTTKAETATAKELDSSKLEAFIGKAVTDCGATLSSTLVVIGDRLGLYRAMAGAGPLTPAELAKRTETSERYVREWLINQAAGGYVEYDAATQRYSLPDEHAVALTDETSPYYIGGAFLIAAAVTRAEPRITEAFHTGAGMHWGEHDPILFVGTERLFRPGYAANLVQSWIPALDGVQQKLERGAKVADVGCGHGASTILLAQAYPNSTFYGYDVHGPSIERAKELAKAAGVADRITFEVATSTNYLGTDFDLIAFFDCLHDIGDPAETVAQARRALADDGTVLLVEPMAGDHVEDNFNPVGRFYSGASVLVCTPNGLATGHTALGTVATEQVLRETVLAGGLTRFRRATETPMNRIFEARK